MKLFEAYIRQKLFEKLDQIFEARLIYLNDFYDMLDDIDDPVANEIFKLRNKDNDNININYIGLITNPKEEDEYKNISFVSDTLMKQKKEESNLEYGTEEEVTSLALSQKKQIMKIGRFAQKILKLSDEKFTNKQIEDFVNKFIAANNKRKSAGTFELLSGVNIYDGYDYDKYKHLGSLNSSCMADKPMDWFYIYSKNPKTVSMLVLKNNDNKIIGRSLIWKNVTIESTDENITFMDRIYYTNDYIMDYFKSYAVDQGWAHKQFNDYSQKKGIIYQGRIRSVKMFVLLDKSDFGHYPYVDTFTYLDINNGIAYNYDNYDNAVEMSCTDGRHEGQYNEEEESYEEGYFGEQIPTDIARWSENLRSYVDPEDSRYLYLEYQTTFPGYSFNDYVVPNEEDIIHCDIDDADYLKNHCVFSNFHNKYIWRGNALWAGDDFVHDGYFSEYIRNKETKKKNI